MTKNLKKPTLLVDLQKCKTNINKMVDKAAYHKLQFRPHFKTHQSIRIGKIYKELGVNKITVSSVQMAEKFADQGWQDITIAFPYNPLEIKEIEDLSEKINLNILISSQKSAQKLLEITTHKFNYLIEVDAGYNRSGILSEDTQQIERTIRRLTDHKFIGFLTHSGDTYQAKSVQEILNIHRHTLSKMSTLKNQFIQQFPQLIVSIGDTPSCTLAKDFDGADEIRPGNFAFYDHMQYNLGVCTFEDIAVCVACPVVDINEERNEIVIYGGAVHLSKEYILKNEKKIYGQVVRLSNKSWNKYDEDIFVTSLSQEHGIIEASDKFISNIQIGDMLGVIPIHSCLTANLLHNFTILN